MRDAPFEQDQVFTFLFTDIEGSTPLWERHSDAMHGAIQGHDRILRGAFEAHDGHVFKTGGDSFLCAFREPAAALATALRAQAQICRTDFPAVGALKVRIALYTGAARPRDGDYWGTGVNRAARLLAACRGGQVLLCATTKALVDGAFPEGATARSLGLHRLRGVSRQEELFQLVHPDLPNEFAPIVTEAESAPHNLPAQLTDFVGREEEIVRVREALMQSRLLTLTGSGGCGKTRLALEAAGGVLDQFEGGVWFADLAPVTDPGLVVHTLAEAARVYEEGGRSILDSLKAALRRPTLLVMDNCEHLIEASAKAADALLSDPGCRSLRILATSREALGVRGEVAWRVPSLSLPDSDEPSADELGATEAGKLFVRRAQQAQPDFELDDDMAPAIAAICRRLDGIPFAIELAAARVKALPAQQIRERLNDRFRLLTGGGRTAQSRQQTLRATIDWSYNLLNPQERLLLVRLAAFSGAWTLDAAETVCHGDAIEQWEIIDYLGHLVDKSLVVYDADAVTAPYRLLESVREYAREKLNDSPEAVAVRDRHLAYFLDLVARLEPKLSGPEQARVLDHLDMEMDNLRAALQWADGAGEVVAMLRIAKGLHRIWTRRGHFSEGQAWLTRALALGAEACATNDEVEDLCMRAGNAVGDICRMKGEYSAALEFFGPALEIARKRGFRRGVAVLLNNMGIVHMDEGAFDQARAIFQESIAICREDADKPNLCAALSNLGVVDQHQDDFAGARGRHTEALRLADELKDVTSEAINAYHLGEVSIREGKLDEAAERLQRSMGLMLDLSFKTGIASALDGFARLAFHLGDAATGAKLVGAAYALRERIGTRLSPSAQPEHTLFVDQLRSTLGEQFEALEDAGRRLRQGQAVELALGL